jgi:streptogramin lyase
MNSQRSSSPVAPDSREIHRGVDLQRGRLLGRLGLGVVALLASCALKAQITFTSPVLSQPVFPGHMATLNPFVVGPNASMPPVDRSDCIANLYADLLRRRLDPCDVAFTDIQVYPHSVGFFNAASGFVTKFPVLLPDAQALQSGTTINLFQGVAIGPDGNIWCPFVYAKPDGSPLKSYLLRMTPGGVETIYPFPNADALFNGDSQITSGSGNLWMTLSGKNQVVQSTPDGAMTVFNLPNTAYPTGITVDLNGNAWATGYLSGKVYQITPDGNITAYSVGPLGSLPFAIATGPDGNLYVTLAGFSSSGGNKIIVMTPAGVIEKEIMIPVANAQPTHLVFDRDANLWVTFAGTSQLGVFPISGSPVQVGNLGLLAPFDVVIPGRSSSTLPRQTVFTNVPLGAVQEFNVQAYISGFSGVEDHVVGATLGKTDCPEITITGPTGVVCVGAVFYDDYLATGGAGPYSYGLTSRSGSPPAGLTIGEGDPPFISGKATAPGSYTFLISVIDDNGCEEATSFTVTVVDCLIPPVKRGH